MEIAKKRGFTVNLIIVFLLGIFFLIVAAIVYLYILRGVFGRFSVSETFGSVEKVFNIFQPSDDKVAILYSKYTENMLPEGSTWLNDNISTWKKFLEQHKLSYELISDRDIELGKHYKYKLLILPGSKSLSDEEIIAIKKYLDQGGSVFATSGTASFSADGKWRGWEFFSEVFGLKFTRDFLSDDISRIHTLRGNLPLTANIPTGYPLKIATWDRPIAVEVLEPRTTQVSFWYNFRKEDGLVREEIKKTGGIANGTYGKGRFVWMGFEINSVIGIQEDFVYFDILFKNSIDWLTYKPISYIKDWPGNYQSAAIILVSFDDQIGNVRNLLPILRAENVKANFFLEPSISQNNKDLISQVSNYGEVGAILDIGYLSSINDTINKLDSYETQISKVNYAKKELSINKKSEVKGILPYYGLFDENSLKALAEADFNYIITDSLTDRSVPKILIKGDKNLISLTKTARDDYEIINNYGLTQPEFQLYTYKEDVDRLLFEGGLYVFKIHTSAQCQPQYVEVVRDVIKYLKSKNVWLTTTTDIYNWWIRKQKVEMRIEQRGERRVAVTVSNPSKNIIDECLVEVNLQTKVENIELTSEIIGTKLPQYSYDSNNNMIYLYIKNLTPGESRIYYIDYDIPKLAVR
ncbi:MAG: hypothetical protein STSR0008_09730 [Ignavibacterium sp.]